MYYSLTMRGTDLEWDDDKNETNTSGGVFVKISFVFSLFAIILIMISCNSIDLSGIKASMPDMTGKTNGVYRGNYSLSGTPVRVTLDVTVQDNNITEIRIIKHIHSPIGRKAEKITQNIIEEQSLEIDAVSGATGSSKAILKAVENALQ